MIGFGLKLAGAVAAVATGFFVYLTFGFPPVTATQTGFRGTGMQQVAFPASIAKLRAVNAVPEAQPAVDESGEKSSALYENVQVLGDLDSNEFVRFMAAITEWVAPQEGCNYCHEEGNLASDKLYQKVVARRMIQMTIDLNTKWKAHVADTGVTCYTCHRGNPVPANIWFKPEPGSRMATYAGWRADDQNRANPAVAYSSLPGDPFSAYLNGASPIRVQPTAALPGAPGASIHATEGTYGLMMHMSDALGVNCTTCHNTQAFGNWQQAGQTRAVAWHGIRMARDLNKTYLEPLTQSFPSNRLGPTGDVAKVNCATCHQGANKPLLGLKMVDDYVAALRP
jgi:photosynthetic reaction center cytochrome c subunit